MTDQESDSVSESIPKDDLHVVIEGSTTNHTDKGGIAADPEVERVSWVIEVEEESIGGGGNCGDTTGCEGGTGEGEREVTEEGEGINIGEGQSVNHEEVTSSAGTAAATGNQNQTEAMDVSRPLLTERRMSWGRGSIGRRSTSSLHSNGVGRQRLQVRSNVGNEVLNRTRGRSGTVFLIVLQMIQFVATVIILGLSWDDQCETPLFMWNSVYAGRLALYTIVLIYERVNFANLQTEEFKRAASNVRRIKVLLELAAFAWFIAGNVYLFSTDEVCKESLLYDITWAWVVYGYLCIALPALVCCAVVLCLPWVFIIMRLLKEDPGASNKVIAKLPTKKFTAGMYAEEDAQCVICLNNYVEGDELRITPCNHNFHSKCIDKWLKINKKCPLCMQSIDGSDAASNSDDDEEGNDNSVGDEENQLASNNTDANTLPIESSSAHDRDDSLVEADSGNASSSPRWGYSGEGGVQN
eukprot:Nk52_evm37s295 gene=Nk52_evmTU37s295